MESSNDYLFCDKSLQLGALFKDFKEIFLHFRSDSTERHFIDHKFDTQALSWPYGLIELYLCILKLDKRLFFA